MSAVFSQFIHLTSVTRLYFRFFFSVCIFSFVWLFNPSAFAQNPKKSKQELLLDPISITATRIPQRVSTIADSVEVITKEQIENYLPGDFNEILRDAIGGSLEQAGSRGGSTSFRIRGSENNFVGLLINGFKFSSPDGDTFDFAHISPEWIRGVEILRGPQSALYGSDAASGVVNLLFDVGRPGDRETFETRIRNGSHDTLEESFKLKGGTEKTGYAATFSRVDSNGRFRNDAYYRTVGTAAFDYFFSKHAKAHLLFYLNQNRFDATSNDGATNSDLRLETPLTDRELNAFQRNVDQLLGLKFEIHATPWLEYIPKFSFYQRDTVFEDKTDALDVSRPFFSAFNNETTQKRYHFDNQVNLNFTGEKLGLRTFKSAVTTLGFEWEEERFFQKIRGFSNTTVNNKRLARSLYAHQQIILHNGFTIAGGVRADDFDSGKDDVTNKITASHSLSKFGTKVRGAYGTGTKRPSFRDLFLLSTSGGVTQRGNPNLSSEYQESWEVGTDQILLSRKLRLGATYYENELKDLIAFSFTSFPNGTNFENISKVRTKGTEFYLSLVNFHNITFRANYNTLDTIVLDDRGGLGGGDFRKGEELLRRPNWWWSGSITYHPDRFRGTIRMNQVGKRLDRDFRPLLSGTFTFPRVTNHAYEKIDVVLSVDIIKNRKSILTKGKTSQMKDFTVEFQVNNILDRDYDEIFGFNSPGIQWFVGLKTVL